MKTVAMEHQVEGRRLLRLNRECFMLACEQGTGKTWMALADAEDQLLDEAIEAALVLAPKGVHANWVLREIPIHVSVPVRAAYYSAGASRVRKNEVERLFRPRQPGELIVLAMNIDAINFETGYALAARFLKHYKCAIYLDESSRIKSNDSKRTGKAIKLGTLAASRRTMSGTPVTNRPQDLFPQFEFMAPGQAMLGTTSYRSFVSEYSELLPNNQWLMKHIRSQMNPRLIKRQEINAERKLHLLEQKECAEGRQTLYASKEAAAQSRKIRLDQLTAELMEPFVPQMPKRDEKGNPILRNLDKLNAMLKPHMYRVLKKDCLDLPDKIYRTVYYELAPAQQKVYNQMRDELRLEFGEEIDIYSPLTIQTKLQQIASGFILRDGIVNKISDIANGIEDETTALLMAPDENPRLELLQEVIQDIESPFIIWARYRQEIEQIAELLKKMEIPFVQYHGGVKTKEREIAIDQFQAGVARCFLGNAQSGGIGLTLTMAEEAIYYSQSYNAEVRWQSEDRNHRIGTTKNVVYTDLAAVDTIDEKISAALQHKKEMAHSILDA